MRLILALEAKLGRELDPDQVVGIESLSDIAALLDG
jgi:acyl carrier protein